VDVVVVGVEILFAKIYFISANSFFACNMCALIAFKTLNIDFEHVSQAESFFSIKLSFEWCII